MHSYSRGSLAAMALGAVLISTSAVFVKWVHVGPTASAFWRMGLAAVLLLAWLVRPSLRAGWKPQARVTGLLLIASVFFALDLWMWHRSILYVGVGLATLLGNVPGVRARRLRRLGAGRTWRVATMGPDC
jgi:drug/metabolite transporter (DMT)-like permease